MIDTDNAPEIRQFKLVNGDEVICEVVQWHDEEELELVVRKAMKLILTETVDPNMGAVRHYTFRPWMIYGEDDTQLYILNGNHVVGIGFPSEALLYQYDEAVKDMQSLAREREDEIAAIREHENNPEYDDVKKAISRTKKAYQSVEEYLKEKFMEKGGELFDDSDGGGNVIQFPVDPSKLH